MDTNPTVEAKASGNNFPKKAWLKMLTQPRLTFREILATGSMRYVYLLIVLYTILEVFLQFLSQLPQFMFAFTIGSGKLLVPIIAMWIAGLVAASIISILLLRLLALFIKIAGKKFGGQAESKQIFSALAWGNVTCVFALPAFLIFAILITIGLLVDSDKFGDAIASVGGIILVVCVCVAIVWKFIIEIVNLSEAQQFSKWKAFFNLMLGWLIMIGVFLIPMAIIGGTIFLLAR